MKILYLSCHSILEYDEVKLLTELGHEVFSHGAYNNPQTPGDPKRPGIDIPFNSRLFNMSVSYGKENLHQDMIDWADVIICMHVVDWLTLNWSKFTGKRVIWRSIGQSTLNVENMLNPLRRDNLQVVRYSPREKTIPGFVGEDAMIRFYKDPKEFGPWTGENKIVITVGQSMKKRKDFCNFDIFQESTKDISRLVYGPENEDIGSEWMGCPDYASLRQALNQASVYFYTGTYPASYTLNFIEAWMTGIPVVAIGRKFGNSPHELGQNTYEVPDLLDETGGGLYSDNVVELNKMVKQVLNDRAFAESLSKKGREGAIRFFGKDKIKEQWREFLDG